MTEKSQRKGLEEMIAHGKVERREMLLERKIERDGSHY
jgi:hypothetical protein